MQRKWGGVLLHLLSTGSMQWWLPERRPGSPSMLPLWRTLWKWNFVFNHSTPLTESFTTSQCAAQQTQMYCPHENRCGRVIRKFQQGNGDEFVVERRSCISVAECDYLKELCNGTRSVGNATSQCWDLCCPHNLCNSASCVKLTLPLIAIATIFGVISVWAASTSH